MTPRTIDWPAVEADYRAGLAVLAIARRYGISPSTIYRRACKDRWTGPGPGQAAAKAARPSPADLAAERAGAVADKSRPTAGDAGPATREALSPAAELDRLRALAARLRERLEGVIEGELACGAALGGRESPATVLLKLCQITEKIIAIERRIAGAQAPTPAQLSEQDREILERFKRRCGVG